MRDIARAAPGRHLVWHASDGADVIEGPGADEFLPLDGAAIERNPALAAWLRAKGVGLVHAHSVGRAARRRASWAAQELAVPTIVTLHDILFLRREGFEPGAARGADPAWLALTAPFLRNAAAVIAPSSFVADLARRNVEGLEVAVIPNGSPDSGTEDRALAPRAEFAERRPRRVVAVIGAIGPHKGSALVEELARALEGTDIAIVIVGYLDMQVVPGWRGAHLFVHGAYEDADVKALLGAYGAEIALFPHRVPESFSYTLSDAWSAGLPALVAPDGALAERVREHGAGWLLPEHFSARDVAAPIRRLLSSDGADELARVKSRLALPDPGRVPSLDAMIRSLDAFYARFGIAPGEEPAMDSQAVRDLLAKNLDGSLFRVELVRLADEMAQTKASLEATLEFERRQAREFKDESGRWIEKLQADVAGVQADIAREVEARRALAQEIVQLKIHKDAFDLLPAIVRKLLLKKILNARS